MICNNGSGARRVDCRPWSDRSGARNSDAKGNIRRTKRSEGIGCPTPPLPRLTTVRFEGTQPLTLSTPSTSTVWMGNGGGGGHVRTKISGLRKRVQALASKDDDSKIELAEALSDLRDLPRPPDGDRPTLDELVDLTELSKRAVCYLLKVWLTFSDLGIPRDRLARIGWTKLAVIAESCEPGEEEQALAIADTCTVKELPALLKGRRRKKKPRTVQLRLTKRQHDHFETVLLAHGARRPKKGWGLSGKEKALMKALGQ